MTPTLCARCGGILDRCECAALRREGMAMAAALVERMPLSIPVGLPAEGRFQTMDRTRDEVVAQIARAIRAMAKGEPE